MDSSIIDFINKQKVTSVCCLDHEGFPYCFSCFYVFDSARGLIYFKSQPSASHSEMLHQKQQVAGTILPDKLNVLAIKGIQFTGRVLDTTDVLAEGASSKYHKSFPFALAKSGDVHTLKLESIKMTDNTKGFGTKILWERENETI